MTIYLDLGLKSFVPKKDQIISPRDKKKGNPEITNIRISKIARIHFLRKQAAKTCLLQLCIEDGVIVLYIAKALYNTLLLEDEVAKALVAHEYLHLAHYQTCVLK